MNNYFVLSNEKIGDNVYKLSIEGNNNNIKPGQLARIRINEEAFSYPCPVAFNKNYRTDVIYKGDNDIITSLETNDKIADLNIIGNGFDINEESKKPLLIGTDMGLIPIYYLALKLKEKGITSKIIAQYKSERDLLYLNEFHDIGAFIYITLENHGILATYFLEMLGRNEYDYVYTCGPKCFINTISNFSKTDSESLLIDFSSHEDGLILKKTI